MTYEIDGILQATSHVLNMFLYRGGYGKLGTVSQTSFGTTTLQLATIEDANNFEVGMQVVASSTEATATLRSVSTDGGGVITGVEASTGVLTFSANVNDATSGISTAIANGDSLFLAGCRENSATPSRLVVAGLEAWLPSTAPSASESYFGVDRSGNSRLYGLYYDATNVPLYEALVEADMRVMSAGGKISHFFMHPKTWASLAKSLEGKVEFTKGSEALSPKVSFRTITVLGMNGNEIKIVADRACQVNKVWGLELDSWSLESMGDPVSPIDIDGNTVLRVSNSDSVEFRGAFYGQLVCNAPGHNIHIAI